MCGIVGYIGSKDVVSVLVEGLRKLEYRGYDSAGVALVRDGSVDLRRSAGKLGGLGIMLMTKCVDKVEYNDAGNRITLTKFKEDRSKSNISGPQVPAFQRR